VDLVLNLPKLFHGRFDDSSLGNASSIQGPALCTNHVAFVMGLDMLHPSKKNELHFGLLLFYSTEFATVA
jgi:hypothetical protein